MAALRYSAFDFELLLRGLGTEWFFKHTAYKPWPNCKWTQYPLTAFDQIQSENRLLAHEIDRIVVHSHVFGTADYFRNRHPRTMISCTFNFPHALAMRALGVPPGPWWYSRWALENPKVSALRERVHVHSEPYTEIKESMMEDGQLREFPPSGFSLQWYKAL
jgi:2-methylcitrate dehydratase PrpD